MLWFKLGKKKEKDAKEKVPAKKTKKIAPKSKAKVSLKKEEKLKEIGVVTGYFRLPKAAIIKLKKGDLKLNEEILIKGHTTNFRQKALSMEIDRKPIENAKKGKEIGLQVNKRVRRKDKVFKVLL